MVGKPWRFQTERLLVNEWHSVANQESSPLDLADVVRAILATPVTRTLPEVWQGPYTVERARDWIKERDLEGTTLLVVERSSRRPIGLVVLFEEDEARLGGPDIRLGYMLAESVWGRGFASELIRGFVGWCRRAGVVSIMAGVQRGNVASRRVLEKNGFVCVARDEDVGEQLFELRLRVP